jgi:hypothetical protein
MTAEQKAAMDEAFDMIVELTEFVKEQRRGVLDLINEELYKTL